jgi:hypothetical protein
VVLAAFVVFVGGVLRYGWDFDRLAVPLLVALFVLAAVAIGIDVTAGVQARARLVVGISPAEHPTAFLHDEQISVCVHRSLRAATENPRVGGLIPSLAIALSPPASLLCGDLELSTLTPAEQLWVAMTSEESLGSAAGDARVVVVRAQSGLLS